MAENPRKAEELDLTERLKDVDPEPSSQTFFTVAPETPDERRLLMEHYIDMQKGAAFDRRVKMLVVETGPSILAAFIVTTITVSNLLVIAPWTETTPEEEQRAASQMGLILTGTLAFVFGKASDSNKI